MEHFPYNPPTQTRSPGIYVLYIFTTVWGLSYLFFEDGESILRRFKGQELGEHCFHERAQLVVVPCDNHLNGEGSSSGDGSAYTRARTHEHTQTPTPLTMDHGPQPKRSSDRTSNTCASTTEQLVTTTTQTHTHTIHA